MARSRSSGKPEPRRCRVCRTPLRADALLRYEGMPSAAQSFPDADTLGLDRGTDLEVCECSACGLVQLGAEPVPYYREVIRAAAFSDEMRQFRQTQFQTWISRYGLTGKKVLEVGCGRGEYLSLLKEQGADAHGIEYSAASVSACAAQGLSAQRGFIDKATKHVRNTPFDAFVTLNFLEHWPNPCATLKGIGNNLVADGIGLVEVPNFDMILEKQLFSEFISDHLLYFTRASLSFALQSSGFEVLECGSVWHDYILSAVVRKRPQTDLTALKLRRSALAEVLGSFIRNQPAGQVAVWGAGHQALATIALTGIGQNIKYIVDSAPFKQGKFTPATHIPIVPPNELESNPVAAILVMAASYSDEVAALIRNRYGSRMTVAILRDFGLETC